MTLAQFALRWVIDQPGVSTVIPGARNVEQVRQNVAAAARSPLRREQLEGVAEHGDCQERDRDRRGDPGGEGLLDQEPGQSLRRGTRF